MTGLTTMCSSNLWNLTQCAMLTANLSKKRIWKCPCCFELVSILWPLPMRNLTPWRFHGHHGCFGYCIRRFGKYRIADFEPSINLQCLSIYPLLGWLLLIFTFLYFSANYTWPAWQAIIPPPPSIIIHQSSLYLASPIAVISIIWRWRNGRWCDACQSIWPLEQFICWLLLLQLSPLKNFWSLRTSVSTFTWMGFLCTGLGHTPVTIFPRELVVDCQYIQAYLKTCGPEIRCRSYLSGRLSTLVWRRQQSSSMASSRVPSLVAIKS